MHPSELVSKFPEKPALTIAETGESLNFREWDEFSMRASQLFRSLGLRRGDHIAILMENDLSFLPICFGAKGPAFISLPYHIDYKRRKWIT